MKKRSIGLLGATLIFLSALSPNSVSAIEFFMDGNLSNDGNGLLIFVCDNRQKVKIFPLGENRFRFYSIGGNGIMKRKSPLEVAKHVCKYYLKSE